MPKKGDTLTGGTGDVNPQVFKMPVNIPQQTTAGGGVPLAFTAAQQFPIPILRLPQKADKAVIMEILKVRWVNNISLALSIGSTQNLIVTGQGFLATGPTSATLGLNPPTNVYQSSDPRVIDQIAVTNIVSHSPISIDTFSIDNQTPNYHDLTDGDGHGILVATDQLFIGSQLNIGTIDNGVYVAGLSVQADIFYRFKEVTLKEYIGIVQSQQ